MYIICSIQIYIIWDDLYEHLYEYLTRRNSVATTRGSPRRARSKGVRKSGGLKVIGKVVGKTVLVKVFVRVVVNIYKST